MRLTRVLRMPHMRSRPKRPRQYTIFFNNAWQSGRKLEVQNLGYVEACQERGLQVLDPQDLFTPYLPIEEELKGDFFGGDPRKRKFPDERRHPYYHEVPAYTYTDQSYLTKHIMLDHTKALLKTVEVKSGLPERLSGSISDVFPGQEKAVYDVVRETQILDSTQKLLPRNFKVPYIGWNVLEDRMYRPLPYPTPDISWQRSVRREFGIPVARKNMNLMRGMLHLLDTRCSYDDPSFSRRLHLEDTMIRQFLTYDQKLLRFYLPLQQIVADRMPLKPYADEEEVRRTESMSVPNIYPLDPTAMLWPKHVYNHVSNFPLKGATDGQPRHHVHTCVWHNNAHFQDDLKMHPPEFYHHRALLLAFLTALGQARINYGPDVGGDLPAPVTVNFVAMNGVRFHFSAFQLNTLSLDKTEGIKNIFWHDEELLPLYGVCGYVKARPTLEDYNPDVFARFATMYLQNTTRKRRLEDEEKK